jgi:hypothetical protein
MECLLSMIAAGTRYRHGARNSVRHATKLKKKRHPKFTGA